MKIMNEHFPKDNGGIGESVPEALSGLFSHVLKKSGKGTADLDEALRAALESVIEKRARQMASEVAQSVLGANDMVVLTERDAVNRSIRDVLRGVAKGRRYGKWGEVIGSLFGVRSGSKSGEGVCGKVWGTIDLEDDGKLLDAANREIINLRLRISSLEGCLRGHSIEVPLEGERNGSEFDLFSEFRTRSNRQRRSHGGNGALFDESADDFEDDFEDDPEAYESRPGRKVRRRRPRRSGIPANDADDDFYDEEPKAGGGNRRTSEKRQGAPRVESFFKTLEKTNAELAELKVNLEKATQEREEAENNCCEAEKEAKGLRALLARKETKITLLERADTIVPELEETMRAVVALRARLNAIVRAVRDGLDEKEPLGFFEFAQIEGVMDQCSFLLKKIDDTLMINSDGYIEAASLYAEVLADVALNDGIPNYALYEKVCELRGLLKGALAFQNQFLKEQMAARKAQKETSKTIEVPNWWGWKPTDAPADEDDSLVDFIGLLGILDLNKLRNLVTEGNTGQIRREVLRSQLRKFHPDVFVAETAPDGISMDQVKEDADSLVKLLVRIERELLSDIEVLNFYLELHMANSGELVTWEQIYPAMAAFMKFKAQHA